MLSRRFRFQRNHVFREKIKRLAVLCRQWTILPGAVRLYKAEQPAFFGRRLLAKQRTCLLSEFEQADALVEVVLVGVLVLADQGEALALLLAPLGSLPVEEIGVDATVELVDVHGVDSVLQAVVLGLNPADGIIVMLLLVAMADTQGL